MLIAIATLVVALAAGAALVSSVRGTDSPDTSTPAGVVQAYVAAVIDGDDRGVLSHLDPSLGCASHLPEYSSPKSATVSIVSSTAIQGGAKVVVQIDEGGGGLPLLGEGYSHREDFQLTLTDGTWLITGQPWPIYSCEGKES